MILVVGSTKGGVAKTHVALNLAIVRSKKGQRKVLLVDADQQLTAMALSKLRVEQTGKTDFTTIALSERAVRTQILQMQGDYDDVVVDCGGRETSSFRAALTVADKLFVPVPPRLVDVWATEQMLPLIEEAQKVNEDLRAYSFLSLADAQGTDNQEAVQALNEFAPTLTYSNTTLVRRKVWCDAIAVGKSVAEFTPRNSKAVSELRALYRAIYHASKQP